MHFSWISLGKGHVGSRASLKFAEEESSLGLTEEDEKSIEDQSAVGSQWKGSGVCRRSRELAKVEVTAMVSLPMTSATDEARWDVELHGEEGLDGGRCFNQTSAVSKP